MSHNPFLCGWFCADGLSEKDPSVLSSMVSKFPSLPNIQIHKTGNLIIAGYKTELGSSQGIDIAISGTMNWNNGVSINQPGNNNLCTALAEEYAKNGEKVFNKLKGRYVFVIHDRNNNKVILGLDKIGKQHCYYSGDNKKLLFATRADALLEHPEVSNEIDNQGIYNYVYFHAIPSPGTIYKDIKKLINGEYVSFSKGVLDRKNYWQPDFQENNKKSFDQLSVEMNRSLKESVSRLCDVGKAGSFLSGGLDSSTVSGMMSTVLDERVNTFSIGFEAEGYDELDYARIAAKRFNFNTHEYYVTPDDVCEKVPEIARYFDEPFGNSSAIPTFFCAKMAKENGIERLFAGDGGDEIFAGNERYKKQMLFEFYKTIPETIRNLFLEPALLNNSLAGKLPVIKKANSYIKQAKIQLPDRLETYNFLHRHESSEIFTEEFLSKVNPLFPLENLRETYNTPEDASCLNRMMWLDWKRTLHDNDLVKVNRMCELAGVEVVYPMLDDDVVEMSCTIPSEIKMRNKQLRWFFKYATKDFLPEEIINKTKHGFGLPFGVWTTTHKGLQDLAYSSLNSLAKRGIFKSSFIEKTIHMHQSIHAKFYGELVWILMILEIWLDKNNK